MSEPRNATEEDARIFDEALSSSAEYVGEIDALMTDLEACTYAGDLLKLVGFELRYVSMKSEACYYGWPGRHGLIRVAAHRHWKQDSPTAHLGPVIAKITLRTGYLKALETFHSRAYLMTAIRQKIAQTIGRYLIETAVPVEAKFSPEANDV